MVRYTQGMSRTQWLIGVDEVGRGPLAGPVAVGVAAVPRDFSWAKLPAVRDSKQMQARTREAVMQEVGELQVAGELRVTVAMVSATMIDRIGIVLAIERAMSRALARMVRDLDGPGLAPEDCLVKLDGGLRAPSVYRQQETIVRGDASEPIIGLASIAAKVKRDAYMRRLEDKLGFEEYGFSQHKGYGTVLHRAAIARWGLTPEHRRTFCRNFLGAAGK